MKVLYGIQLTGNGHVTRSTQLIKSLIKNGFEVDVITSGNNSQIKLPFKVSEDMDEQFFKDNLSVGYIVLVQKYAFDEKEQRIKLMQPYRLQITKITESEVSFVNKNNKPLSINLSKIYGSLNILKKTVREIKNDTNKLQHIYISEIYILYE